jgi:ribosome-associated translation inhibitor RaiA
VDVIFQSHHAVISDRMRQRAESAVRKLATRLDDAVDARVRFEQDGVLRRVEIVMHAPRRRELVAEGTARLYGPALAEAVDRLRSQVSHTKRTRREAGHRVGRA